MKLFGSLATDFCIGLRGFEKHCTRASLNSDTVEDLIIISVEGPSLEDFNATESVSGLAKAKDQEGQTTGDGHPKGMWLQWRIVHKTLSHEMFSLTPLKLNLDFLFISFILRRFKLKFQFTFSVSYLSCRIVLQIKNFMLTRLLVNRQYSILPIKKSILPIWKFGCTQILCWCTLEKNLRTHVSHDPSEIILICWFIIRVETVVLLNIFWNRWHYLLTTSLLNKITKSTFTDPKL